MSFTTQIKDEITKKDAVDDIISLQAYLKYNSQIDDGISASSLNASVARWLFRCIKSSYKVNINLTCRILKRFSKRYVYILNIKDNYNNIVSDINNINDIILDSSKEEKIAYLKGVFLSSGSINDPKKNLYHMEFLIKDEIDANIVNKLLLDLKLDSKILKREREYMVYVKKSEQISDFIKYLNAINSLFYFEDIRIYKDHKNMVNRLNNCEQANFEKSLKTSRQILDNIKYLEDNDLISLLDDRTKEIIDYKKKYPDENMLSLANIVSLESSKDITKSGINHHFRKINELVRKHQDI